MKMNRSTISAAWVALTRRLSYFLPRAHAVGGDEFEAVCARCRKSCRRWGHCEIPYPADIEIFGFVIRGDIRRQVWIDEMILISPEPVENEDIEWGSV